MPFTIHPDQKPSDDESLWVAALCAETTARAKAAAADCLLHAQNVRTDRVLSRIGKVP